MCGVIGFVGNYDSLTLKTGLDKILNRGPDDHGLWYESDVGMGHSRLSILDPTPLGRQPMISLDGNLILVFNGEIYNYIDLRVNLKKIGFSFRGNSDTEVLLNLYLAYGVNMLDKINGIFSFALWDRTNASLFLARDALGVKPMYYSKTSQGFIFCSEIKGLLPFMVNEGAQLDISVLHRYSSFMYSPGNSTPLDMVKRLSPGEAIIYRGGAIKKQWHWYQLPIFKGGFKKSRSQVIPDLYSHLNSSVQSQMVADVPVGAFLSGGLDSSTVVALASKINPSIQCFTVAIKGEGEKGVEEDLPYARIVAKHLKVPLMEVEVCGEDLAHNLEDMVVKLDEPIADPAALNTYFICKAAREQGIKVLLSGAGGDDIFTGYRRHFALQMEKYWTWLPQSIRVAIYKLSKELDQDNILFRRFSKALSGAHLEPNRRLINYCQWMADDALEPLYSEDSKRHLKIHLKENVMLNFLESIDAKIPALEKMLALDQRFFLGDHNLLYTDKMSMANGVEVRVPLLDVELVEFANQIPLKMKQKRSVGKWVLKRTMEPYLPKEVIYRPKTGFGLPLRKWMKHELRELTAEMLSPVSLLNRGIYNAKAVQALIQQNDKGIIDASYPLFSLVCNEIWCRNFIDKLK